MTRVLLLCPEPGRPAMAGVGIRFWEMARHLGRQHEVRLAFPKEGSELGLCPALAEAEVVGYDRANLAEICRWSEAVVLHAHVSNLYLDTADHCESRPLVVDLYDPFPIENLTYFRTLGDGPYRHDRMTFERQLRQGDLFLCSSPEQRLFYLGMLYTLGRLNPETYFADFTLANLVREVPFGITAPEPVPAAGPGAAPAPLLRGVVPGIGPDDPVLFFGGIYDWYDPMLLIRRSSGPHRPLSGAARRLLGESQQRIDAAGNLHRGRRRLPCRRMARPPRLLRALGARRRSASGSTARRRSRRSSTGRASRPKSRCARASSISSAPGYRWWRPPAAR